MSPTSLTGPWPLHCAARLLIDWLATMFAGAGVPARITQVDVPSAVVLHTNMHVQGWQTCV